MYYLIPQTKEAIRQWKHLTTPAAKKCEVCQTAGKVVPPVIWNAGDILIEFMTWGTTIIMNA
jgi:hypothetical protein